MAGFRSFGVAVMAATFFLSTLASALAQYRTPGTSLPAPGAARPTLNMCTGIRDGNYIRIAEQIQLQSRRVLDTKLIGPTQGSLDNVQRVVDGTCDAAIAQSDALRVYKDLDPKAVMAVRVTSLYKEYVHLVCNRSAGLGRVTDLAKNHVIITGAPGSGANVTWQSFVAADKKRYSPVKMGQDSGGLNALMMVKDGIEATCMMFVGGLGAGLIKNDATRFNKNLVLVPVDDRDFDDEVDASGRKVYEFVTIPASTYPGIMPTGGLFSSAQDLKTVAVDAVLIVNADWKEKNQDAYDNLLRTVMQAGAAIEQIVSPKKKQ